MKKIVLAVFIISLAATVVVGQVIQAENMIIVMEGDPPPVIIIRDDDVAFFSNGAIKTIFNGTGDYKLKFNVRTSTSGANFRIQPPNLNFQDFIINNQQFALFETTFNGVQAGEWKFSFTNDIRNTEGDRNLFLDYVEFLKIGGPKKVNVCLSWSPNTEADLAGYKIHWGLASGKYSQTQDVGNTTLVCLDGFAIAFTYYFAVSAYNSKGLESQLSTEFPLNIKCPK